MNTLKTVKDVLAVLYANSSTIIAIVVLAYLVFLKVKTFASLTKEEKIEIAKHQIANSILGLVSDAEKNEDLLKAGAIKRSNVLAQIYNKYPILAQVVEQEELTKWIDDQIKLSLLEIDSIAKKNKGSDVNE